jgi:predicted glycogen debranching enzyme
VNRRNSTGAEPSIWRGMTDGPWPAVIVGGDLEHAENEWLASNNLGVYAMSTVALMHTRRQHGLLVSPLAGDFRRHVVLSHLEMTLEVAGRTHKLSTHQFPNMAPTLGYRALEKFSQDPVPRWKYQFPSGIIERTVTLVHNRQAVVIALTWSGKEPARLTLRPLMPMRPADELTGEHGGMLQKVTLRTGEVEVQPVHHLPPVVFQHRGVFMGYPDWWRKFEYLDDRGLFDDFQEDMWSPGVFEFQMAPRETTYLMVSVGPSPVGTPKEHVMEAAQRLLASDPVGRASFGEQAQTIAPEVRALSVAAESFVFADGTAIVAGYPWLDVWSRDTLMALPGVYLVRGEEERAKRSIRHLLRNQTEGFLTSRTTAPEDERRPCVDASLWLYLSAHAVMNQCRADEEFCADVYAVLVSLFRRIVGGDRTIAWLSAEGLLVNGAEFPLTWMDATHAERVYTPRRGLAVEFQALWVKACEILASEAEARGDSGLAEEASERAREAQRAFAQVFWCQETNHPFDCLSEHRDSADTWADPSIRPNALIALSLCPQLFESWQATEILDRVESKLLTERGIRTLEPGSPEYVGHGGDTVEERSSAHHQGTVWPHLLLFYVRSKLREDPSSGPHLRELVNTALRRGRALGHVGQCADGDPPHRPWGIPAYAAATGMLLEALAWDLAGY